MTKIIKCFYFILLAIWYLLYPIGTVLIIIGHCFRTDFYNIPIIYRQFLKDIKF